MATLTRARRGVGISVLAALVAGLTACAGSTGAPAAGSSGGGEIVIGSTLPLTGSAASYGAIMRDGMELGIAAVNAAGGVDGRKLRGEYQDSQGNPGVSVGLTRQLVSNNVAAITTCFPAVALAQQAITSRASVPLFGPCFNEDAELNKDGLFNLTPTTDEERIAMLTYLANQRGFRKVAILAEAVTSAASQQALVAKWQQLTGSPAELRTIETGAADATPQLTQLLATQPDALFVLVNGTLGDTVVNNLAALGVKQPLFGNVAASGYLASIQRTKLDWTWTNAVSDYSPAFMEAFTKAHPDRKPTVWDGSFYNAVHVIAAGLRYAKDHSLTVDAKGLTQALKDNRTWTGGCCGDLTFLPNNGVNGTFAIMNTAGGGAPTQVTTVPARPQGT